MSKKCPQVSQKYAYVIYEWSQRQNAIKEATAKSEKKVFGGGDGTKIKEGKREERRGGRGGRGRDNNRAANGHEGSEEPPQDNKGKVTLEYRESLNNADCGESKYLFKRNHVNRGQS